MMLFKFQLLLCVCVDVWMCVSMSVCVCVYVCAYMYVCVCVYVYKLT